MIKQKKKIGSATLKNLVFEFGKGKGSKKVTASLNFGFIDFSSL